MPRISQLLTIKSLLSPLILVTALVTLPVQAGLFDWLGLNKAEKSQTNSDFLPMDQAFVLSSNQTAQQLQLSFTIEPDYYLYRHTVAVSAKNAQLGDWVLPGGTPHEDEYFGKSQVYYEQLTLAVPLQEIAADGSVEVRYQGCTSGLCYPPQTIHIPLIVKNKNEPAH